MDPLVKKLLAWYRRNGRDLPWRKTRNPYHIFISEMMLQQTQVDHVIPKYHAFLRTFPTWKSLASATAAQVIHAWAGLGYNRRALYTREAARIVAQKGVPSTETAWRTLKGVGPYAAAALTEFVQHKRAIVIDTNIRRVIGRALLGTPYPMLTDDARITKILECITPRTGAHWKLPQASMDLANSICLARKPLCAMCPLASSCKSTKKFLLHTAIKKQLRRPTERIHAEKKYPDRIYRGKILRLVREHGAMSIEHTGRKIDPTFDPIQDDAWLREMIRRLIKDGLLIEIRNRLSLPKT